MTRPKYPPYRETGVAIPLSHFVSCGIADYPCYTPTSFHKMAYRHVCLNSVQQKVSGELAGEDLQTGFSRHGLLPQRALLDTVYPLREHLNSVANGVWRVL